MTALGLGPVFRFEVGTSGRFGKRRITFLRAASTGYLVEVLPHPEAERIPDMMRGTRPDIEFVGRKVIPHAELTAALLDGSLDIDEDDYVFVDHSQTFKGEILASLADRPAQDMILRYATVTIMREIAKRRGLVRPSRNEVKAIEPEILSLLPDRIDMLTGKVDRLRRHPMRRRKTPAHVSTAQSILDWDERLKTRGFFGLVDMLHLSGNRTCKLAPEVAAILDEEIDLLSSREGVPYTAIHDAVDRRVTRLRAEREADLLRREAAGDVITEAEREEVDAIKPPTLKTVRNHVRRSGPLVQAFRRQGPDWLLRNQLVTGMGLHVERAGQIVMIDEYDADLMTIIPYAYLVHWLGAAKVASLEITEDAPCRGIISMMIDAYTGIILGLQIGLSADQDLAQRTCMMSLMDKSKISAACGAEESWDQYLRPEVVLHDSGNAYLAAATELMCASLRIDKIAAPKAKAFLRGLMERVFRTVHERLLSRIPGKTFSNPVKRGEYDSEAEAVLTIDDLIQVLIVWIVDIYHNSPNLGRDGLTPADLWRHEMAVGMGCRPVPSLRVMTHVFGTTLTRRAQGTGIRIMHANYSSEEFARLLLRSPTRAFRVRWWEENMSEAQVEVKPRVWMPLEVMDPRARGLSVDEWMLVLKRAHVARDPEAAAIRRRAGEQIDDLIEDRIAMRRKVRRKTMTEERLLQAEERALRFFRTPTTEITSAETHGLYGVPVGIDHDEDGVVRENPTKGLPPEPVREVSAAHRARRQNTRWTPGTME